jgi:hypothetical protein
MVCRASVRIEKAADAHPFRPIVRPCGIVDPRQGPIGSPLGARLGTVPTPRS